MKMKSLLKQGWQITWRYPFLWFFGLFAALFWGNEITLLIKNLSQLFSWAKKMPGANFFVFNNLEFFLKIPSLLPQSALIYFSTLIVLGLLFIYLTNLSIGAIISSSQKIKAGETLSFRGVFKTGVRYSLIILLINLLAYLITFGLLAIPKIPGLQTLLKHAPFAIFLVLTMAILIFLTVIISFLSRFTACAVVVEKMGIFSAIKRAVQTLKKNFWPTLILTFYLFLLSLLVALFVLLVLAATSMPFFVFSAFFHQVGLSFLFKPLSYILFFISIILIIFLGSIFSTFQIATWTVFFLKLKEQSDIK